MEARIDYKKRRQERCRENKRIQPKKESLIEKAFWFGLLIGLIYLCLITISNYQ